MTQHPQSGDSDLAIRPFWFIPAHGDGRWLGSGEGARSTDFTYLSQIAVAADRLGYEGVLIPTGRTCEDSWVLASGLAAVTRRLKFLVAVRPGVISPFAAVRMASTLDRISEGRLLINVVAGGDGNDLAGDGIFLEHDERYALADEYLTVWKRLMSRETVDHAGTHIRAKGARLLFPPVQAGGPPLYLGGSSDAALDVTAKHIDVYLTWGEPLAAVKEKIAQVTERASKLGRTVKFGIRLHVIVRETEDAAWDEANRLISRIDDRTIEKVQTHLAASESVGQARMRALHGGRRDKLVVAPNLWAGIGLVRGGAGTALVGSAENVAARILEYREAGIESFIFSGYPHLEESYRLAELVFPLLRVAPSTRSGAVIERGEAGEAGAHLSRRAASTGPS